MREMFGIFLMMLTILHFDLMDFKTFPRLQLVQELVCVTTLIFLFFDLIQALKPTTLHWLRVNGGGVSTSSKMLFSTSELIILSKSNKFNIFAPNQIN
jgi:hypothetical protein